MKIGSLGFCTHQGIAHIMRDLYRHDLVQRVMVFRHRAYTNLTDVYPTEVCYKPSEVELFLMGLDALWLIETDLSHDWMVSRLAKQKGIKLILSCMYEYSAFPCPVKPDLVLCPSLLDFDYYKPHYNSVFIPIPVEQPWLLRERALEFVHNAGHGQWDYAKGTVQLIEAMDHVRSPVTLKIRAQTDDRKMADLHARYKDHPRIVWELNPKPEDLYATGDVFINAEKLNGVSLPLQEAWASGLCVVTSARYPATTWLPPEPLIPVSRYEKCRIPGGSGIEFDKAVVDPVDVARVIDGIYNQDISRFSLAGREWAEANSWERLKPVYNQVIAAVL